MPEMRTRNFHKSRLSTTIPMKPTGSEDPALGRQGEGR